MTAYVLVHGAWFGSWSWAEVAAHLRRAGHEVLALDLPSYGADRRSPTDVTFAEAVDTVVQALRSLPSPPVLVAHSRGGMVTSAAAEVAPAAVRRLVYVAAHIPVGGRTTFDIASEDDDAEGLATVRMSADGSSSSLRPDRALLQRVYMADVAAADVDRAVSLLQEEPTAFGGTPVVTSAGAFGVVPKSSVVTVRDRALSAPVQRRLAAAAGVDDVHEVDASHLALLSQPAVVADLLVRAGALAGGGGQGRPVTTGDDAPPAPIAAAPVRPPLT